MENEKPSNIDEKTAKLIEEMDKSLHNMEQTLGMDHMVLAKILDSYAKLLRQNNIRHLDALNMEARAKAIRAKHNQEEAEKQIQGLEETHEAQKGITVGHLKLMVWGISIAVVGIMIYGTIDMMQKSGEHIKKMRAEAIATAAREERERKRREQLELQRLNQTAESNSSEGTDTATTTSETSSESEPSPEQQESNGPPQPSTPPKSALPVGLPPGPPPGLPTGIPPLGQGAPAQRPSDPALDAQVERIKTMASDNLAVGLAAENEKDYPKATQAYQTVVLTVKEAQTQTGRRIASEDIARCYEGYARMADLDSHPDVAREWNQAAAEIRSHI